jgi:hypothetical protein
VVNILGISCVSAAPLIAAAVVFLFAAGAPVDAQSRGLYTPGQTVMNSGALPEAGLSYQNLLQVYSFDELKGPEGHSVPVNGKAALFIDQAIFVWVSPYKILGGTYAATANLAVNSSSLTTVALGTIAGGAGVGDTYVSPFTLGWNEKRADVQVGYAFSAPTGRFTAGATDNTGSGLWGHLLTAGQTVYLTANKHTAASAFEVYEFHATQNTTNVHPGQTFDIDYSLTQTLPLDKNQHTLLQGGIVGYGQYQTTDRTGPSVDPTIAAATHYRVNALGGGANVIVPARKVTVGITYFKEFLNASTVEGHSLQIVASVTF